MWWRGDGVGVMGDQVGEQCSAGREDEVGGEPQGEIGSKQESVQFGDSGDGGGRGVYKG